MTRDGVDEALSAALAKSLFARLSPSVASLAVEKAKIVELESGEVVYANGDRPRVLLLVTGILRDYLIAPDGRQATATYLRSGDLCGIFTLGQGHASTVNVQALTRATAIELQPGILERLARQDAAFAWELGQELARRWGQVLDAMCINTFGTVRQRIIRHLLSVAKWDNERGRFVAKGRYEEIADSVGTVPDVVGRELRKLREAEHVDLERGLITLRNPELLESELGSVPLSKTKVLSESPSAS